MTWKTKIIYLFLIYISCVSCYTFSGSSIDPSIKTIQINTFPNYAALQNPNLSLNFTTALQNRFNQRTRLISTNTNPDLLIEGEISDYSVTPVNVQSGTNMAAQNKLTITVKVRYENKLFPDKNFEKSYSDYETFDANALLDNIADGLSDKINTRIIDLIFNDIATNW